MLPGSILQQLVDRRDSEDSEQSGRTPLNFGVYYKNTLVALCHALEDAVIATDCSPLMVTAFQQGKWYLQEADRYGDIAKRASHIAIMAAPGAGFHDHPTSQLPNVFLVDLAKDDPVAQEWHLMILDPSYSAMVLCQELSDADYGPNGRPENDLERKFYGFWTFDPELVRETIDISLAHLGQYDPELQATLQQRLDQIQVQPAAKTDGISEVVVRVVDYLQEGNSLSTRSETLQFANALRQNLASSELQAFLRMAQLADIADPTNPLAASEVASLAEMMAQLLELPVWQLQRLRLASLLHRIAPLQPAVDDETGVGPSCPLNQRTQALRIMPRMRAVARILAHQGEWWNGTGQPGGLAGDQIPVESRILALVAAFQAEVTDQHRQDASVEDAAKANWQHITNALTACQAEQGERWDPKLVEVLGFLVKGLQQGLSLPTIPMKVSLGSGLLNPDMEDAWPEPTEAEAKVSAK
ncbi:metal-dependent phosphohydrolase [Romeria aff. gracilis LEGE 07310]|uniref:Metal-dependent phosphohydrolase n=1 Tax=Vasconcelosia minhoensis LEGE 07310 TaxID=915328 RepID=A0A8J7AMI3_9CYAN|nr:DICT sensory domain-containing protein [Romeria gracilis]MBE9077026.1 metal-dependent phosphohydrolase [Romeria aff. gracilis LEGE 07310]